MCQGERKCKGALQERGALFEFGIKRITILGGGPAGLRAAEVAVAGGAKVTVYDGKASVGRKFLVAGRGGLNLTHTEVRERFVSRYSGGKDAGALWNSLLDDFNSEALRDWARGAWGRNFCGDDWSGLSQGDESGAVTEAVGAKVTGLGSGVCHGPPLDWIASGCGLAGGISGGWREEGL